jgi:hypothetical protein
VRVLPDDQLAGTLTPTRLAGDSSPAEVPVTGGFTARLVDITGLVQGSVTDPLKLLPEDVKQVAQSLATPLMDHVRKRSMAVEAKFSLHFGGIQLTFTAVALPLHAARLTDQRTTEQWQGSTKAEVECAELVDYVIEQVKRRSADS